MYSVVVTQSMKMLNSLSRWLDKAAEYANQKKFPTANLVTARLAPDQFHLARQIQAACDTAKFGAARLTAKQPPSHPDTEQTFEELQARIRSVIGYLETFKPEDFEGVAERRVGLAYWGGKTLTGQEFYEQYVIPNFYFHVTTAYAILRHNGVDVGKSDYLGTLPLVG